MGAFRPIAVSVFSADRREECTCQGTGFDIVGKGSTFAGPVKGSAGSTRLLVVLLVDLSRSRFRQAHRMKSEIERAITGCGYWGGEIDVFRDVSNLSWYLEIWLSDG